MKQFWVLLGLFFLCFPVDAQAVRSAHTTVQLVTENTSIQPGQTFWVGLRMQMDPQWHTYWRNPGDAGLPTTIKWQLPTGFSAGAIQWPHPEYIATPPLGSYGYEGETLLLTQLTAPATLKPGTTVTLQAKVTWLECRDVCLPGKANLSLSLPVAKQSQVSPARSALFTTTRSQLPLATSDWQIQVANAGQELILQGMLNDAPTLEKIHFFPYQDLLIEPAAPQVLTQTKAGFRLALKKLEGNAPPERLQGVLVAEQGWRGANSEQALLVDIPLSAATDNGGLTLGAALGLAFLGGLILNLMPCVLPVLSIKILGFVQQAGADPTKVRWHGVAFMAGVLVSFWILAGTLLALRAGGENLGWGFQLQSPAFLVVLSSLLFLFGLNLFGVFEIGTSLTRVGESVSTTGLAGSFSSGVLATVVATPCTAPYMGSALGFALTQSNIDALLIFSSVGLGMAAPYVILTWNPRLLKFVPKPGAWMETFKQVLGFPMLATVVWLVWVLGVQMGVDAVVSLLAGLLLLGLGAWILGRWGTVMQSIRTRSIANVLALVAFGAGLALALSTATSESAAATSKPAQTTSSLGWEPYSPERVAQLKKAGTPLFIDFTAAWCLSCQVNERVALNTPEVAAAFRAQKIVLLKADWTRRDARITEALAQFGRSGVPLYVLIRGGKTQLLPEVLTPAVVLNALGSSQ